MHDVHRADRLHPARVTDIAMLVVDDHPLFADALAARLSQEIGVGRVEVAYTVGQARSVLTRFTPDVAVLDVALTDGSGLDLAAHVREVSAGTAVVMLTGVESVDSVVTALRHGVRAWLPKTVDLTHLVRVIRGVARGEAWLDPQLLGRVLPDLVHREPAGRGDPLSGLTTREREVLQCLVDGLNRIEIARRLHLSANTVRTHTQNLLAKLGAHSTLESVAVAMRHGVRASSG